MLQLNRYFFVGVLVNIIGYIIYVLLAYFGITPAKSMSILYVVGALLGFYFNRSFTFQYDGKVSYAICRYVLVLMIGYLLNLSIFFIFIDMFGYPHYFVQAIAIIVVAFFMFMMSRIFVFSMR